MSTNRKLGLRLIALSVVMKLLLASFATQFVLVDDAYITLRYASNLVTHGDFVYNAEEAVFGITTPLWGLLTGLLTLVAGSLVDVALIVANIALWSWAAWLASDLVSERFRFTFLALFLFAPCFVDNQLLGMETSLFVLLMIGSMQNALQGRATASAAFFGLLAITRPEACLLSPFLFAALASHCGAREALRKLLRPAALACLLLPGIAWATFALTTYGGLIPQSMLAKTGWNTEHYDDASPLTALWRAVPRLTFIPFIDALPSKIATVLSSALMLGIAWVTALNWKRGTAASRAWLGFYFVYITFYVVGKGATEASWYSIPSSVALLFALEPAWPTWLSLESRALRTATLVLLISASSVAALRRGELLRYYEDGYGESARLLNQEPTGRVVIGEIGVFGFHSKHAITDVAALVSPEVLDMKRRGLSFIGIVRESDADWFVISETALTKNFYPSVGVVWANVEEREWFASHCSELQTHLDKHTFKVLRSRVSVVARD